MEKVKDDFEKALLILSECKHQTFFKKELDVQSLTIEDEFLRSRMVMLKDNADNDYLVNSVLEYKEKKLKLDSLESEDEKAQFILQLEDNDMKLEFLKQIKGEKNRELIITSFRNDIKQDIFPQTQCAQNMIRKFFKDTLGEKFDRKMQEKLEIAFNRTSIKFTDELDSVVFGRSRFINSDILINRRMEKSLSKVLQLLIHEYGHIFSNFDFKTTGHSWEKAIEEGTQDLFSELVINHYLEKHKSIEINGQKVRIDYPYISYSGYNWENGWQRTMLYPLSKMGQDIEALAEYQFGDKNKYLEMILGEELAKEQKRDKFGNPELNINLETIYMHHINRFKNLDRNSCYYRRNWILPLYEIQNKLDDNETKINLFDIKNDEKWLCSYIAEKYFSGRKMYDISKEEFTEFRNLIFSQEERFIFKYDEYANKIISELEEKEIKEKSFEILDVSTAAWKHLVEAGANVERVWGQALNAEIKKVNEGQDVSESLRKYKAIIPDFLKMLSRKKADANEFLLDAVKDLKFAYLQQLEDELLKEEKRTDIVKCLTDEKTGEFFMDSDITQLLSKYNVTFELNSKRNKDFGVQDIIGAAIRANISIDELTGEFKFIIGEKDLSR